MKTKILTFILFLIAAYSFGQISFEKGYFISNDNRRVECLIKNSDWKDNPNEIIFMKKDSGKSEIGNISFIKEFGIYGYSRFVRANVQIDRSSNETNKLTDEKNPDWSMEQLFLKVVLDGKASLFSFEDGNLKRFFYSVADNSISQLIFNRYLVNNSDTIAYNNRFRQQLWMNVRCSNTSMGTLENLNYNQNDLEKYFTNYSKCFGDSIVKYENKKQRDVFNLKVAAGLNMASLSTSNSMFNSRNADFGSNLSFLLGIESEFIFPFKMNKWSLIIEPTFQYFNSKVNLKFETVAVKYSSVDLPIGIRYYFFLNQELKVFLNGLYISNFNYNFNSKLHFGDTYFDALKIKPADSYAVGGGIEHKRISAEIRYYSNKELFGDYLTWKSDYNRLSVIIGYKLIKTRHNK